jgi:membrane-associated phospholipid phosphatase
MKMPYSEAKRSILFWKSVSRIISVAFHPLLLPTILFMLLARYAPITLGQFSSNPSPLLIIILVSTFVLPLLLFVIFIMIVYGKFSIDKILLDGRQDRVLPFLFIGIFYCGLTYLLYTKIELPGLITLLIASMSLCILLVGLVSAVWKVSAHAAGITGLIGFMIVIQSIFPDMALFNPVVGMIVVAGFVLSSRLYLKAHTPAELMGGCVIGIATATLVYVVATL